MKRFDPGKLHELIDRSYLGKEEEDRTHIWRCIVQLIEEHDEATAKVRYKFLVENHCEDALDNWKRLSPMMKSWSS